MRKGGLRFAGYILFTSYNSYIVIYHIPYNVYIQQSTYITVRYVTLCSILLIYILYMYYISSLIKLGIK